MILYEPIKSWEGKILVHSDSMHRMIRDDGKKMSEDIIEEGEHTYEETDEKVGEKEDYEQAMKILLGLEA